MARAARDISNEIAIAEFRFEDAGDGFRVFVRRQLGWASLFILCMLLLFIGLGVGILGNWIAAAWRGFTAATPPVSPATTRPSRGPPVCCVPFVLLFIGFWLSVPLRGLAAYARGWRGKELWLFRNDRITPPSSVLTERAELRLTAPVRAGVSMLANAWVVGVSSGAKDLIIGPFKTPALAQAFAAEVRRRRPEWFADDPAVTGERAALAPASDKTAAPSAPIYGIPEATSEPAEPIRSCTLLPGTGGAFDLLLRRRSSRKRRSGATLMAFWLCGWLAGEVMVSTVLWMDFTGAFQSSVVVPTPTTLPATPTDALAQPRTKTKKNQPPPRLFLLAWLTLWTYGGAMAISNLALHLKRTERWRFDAAGITAGPSWRIAVRRTVPDDGTLHARVLQTPAGAEIEFVSTGVALRLGPVPDETVLRQMVTEIRQRRPRWIWHGGIVDN